MLLIDSGGCLREWANANVVVIILHRGNNLVELIFVVQMAPEEI